MKKTTSSLFLFLCIFIGTPLFAQQDLTTLFLSETWASTFSNPAWVPEKRAHIGLPSMYFSTSGASINVTDLIDFSQNNPTLDLGEVANAVEDEIFAQADLSIHPIYFSIALKDFRVGLEYSLMNKSFVQVPGDLIRFGAFGNAPYIDQTLELAPSLYNTAYQKLSFPISYQKENWTFGFRPAFLHGIVSVNTVESELSLYTDPEFYQLTLNGNFNIQSSSILALDSDQNLGVNFNEDFLNNGLSWKSNGGFSIDLGARFQVNQKLKMGASIINIGQITWDKNVTSFTSEGTQNYNGIDLNPLVSGDSLDIDETVDDLVRTFQLKSDNISGFKTKLPVGFYLNGSYKVTESFSADAVVYAELFNKQLYPSFALNGRIRVLKFFYFGLSYGMRYNQWNNLGINTLIQLGPVQLFGATNNILTLFDPLGNSSTNGRFGMAVAFGKKKVVYPE